MEMTIRRALPKDVPAILAVTHHAFREYARAVGQDVPVKALGEKRQDVEADLMRKTVLVAVLDGVVAGSIRYERLPGNLAYVGRVGVDPKYQRFGLGRALMEAVVERCQKEGYDAMVLHTASKLKEQVRFYYNNGFYIHSTTHDRGYIRALFCRELKQPFRKDLFTLVPKDK